MLFIDVNDQINKNKDKNDVLSTGFPRPQGTQGNSGKSEKSFQGRENIMENGKYPGNLENQTSGPFCPKKIIDRQSRMVLGTK